VTAVPAGNLLAYLAQVPDPRGRQGRRHPLAAMLAAVVCAMLCGARGYSAIVQWLHALPVPWWHRLGFTRRPPKDHAFRDLLAAIPPEVFEAVVRTWAERFLKTNCGRLRWMARLYGARSRRISERSTCCPCSINVWDVCSASSGWMRKPTSTKRPWNS